MHALSGIRNSIYMRYCIRVHHSQRVQAQSYNQQMAYLLVETMAGAEISLLEVQSEAEEYNLISEK